MTLPTTANVVKINVLDTCDCEPFTAKYGADGSCLKCGGKRPNDIKVYNCPANCDHGKRGARECPYCDGNGYIG